MLGYQMDQVAHSSGIAARPSRSRSRVTNGSEMLRGIDARTAEARRFRDLCEGFTKDLGSPPGARDLALVRQAAALTVQTETMQAKIVRGEDVNVEQLTRLANGVTRTLRELGIRKRGAQRPSLEAYLVSKSNAEAVE